MATNKKRNSRRTRGTGQIIKPAGCKRYYLRLQKDGQQRNFPLLNPDGTPCTTREDAEKASRNQERILQAATLEETALYVQTAKNLKRQSGLVLTNAWETYLKQPDRPDSGESTLDKYKRTFEAFLAWLDSSYPKMQLVAEVDRDTALEFMQSVAQSGDSNATYNKYLQTMRLIFKHLMVPAALDINPFDNIPKKPIAAISRKEFTPEQVKAIFNGFDNGFFYDTVVEKLTEGRIRKRVTKRIEYKPMFKEEMRVLLLLCCWTGCRGQDGCLMEWSNIDLERRLITYIPRKTARKTGYRKVTLPMKAELYDALLDAVKWKGNNKAREDYILPNVADRYKRNPSGVQKDVMKIIHCATGEETTASKDRLQGQRKLAANVYSLHSFRHTFVSFCANAGVPLAVVAEIVGHGNPAMTEHYSHISTAAKQEAINALPFLKEIPMSTETPGPAEAADATADEGVIDVTANIIVESPDPLAEMRQKAIEGIQKARKRTLQKILALLG